jgi:hypothetical protein
MVAKPGDDRNAIRALLARSSIGTATARTGQVGLESRAELATLLVQRAVQTLAYRQHLNPALLAEPIPSWAQPTVELADAVAAMFTELEYELARRMELDPATADPCDWWASADVGCCHHDLDDAAVLEDLDGPIDDPGELTDLSSGVRHGVWDSGLAHLIGLPALPSVQRRIVALRDS